MKLTDDAAAMINELVEERDLPAGAGLRIAPSPEHEALAMDLAPAPGPADVVLTQHEASVFLAPVAEVRLEDATLDARHGELGPAFFVQP